MAEKKKDEWAGQPVAKPKAGEDQWAGKPVHNWAETVWDVIQAIPRGINKGAAEIVTAPYRIPDWIGEQTGLYDLPNMEDTPLWSTYLKPKEAETTPGKFAQSMGEAVGSGIVPEAGMLIKGGQLARRTALPVVTTGPGANAPLTVQSAGPGAARGAPTVGERFLAPYATNPAGAVLADASAALAAGAAQEGAKEAGFGPVGQMVSGMVGGFLPGTAAATLSAPRRVLAARRSKWSPHHKVAESLPDGGIDDLATATAVGTTNMTEDVARRTIDELGRQMVATGGDRQAAVEATIQALAAQYRVRPETVRGQLNAILAAQRDNNLFLGEYPAVMDSNLNTRRRNSNTVLRDMDQAYANPDRAEAQGQRVAADPGRSVTSPTHWMMETVAHSGSPAAHQIVNDAVKDRMPELHRSVENMIRGWAPEGLQTPGQVDAALEALRQQGRQAYRQVYDARGNAAVNYGLMQPLLQRVVDRHLNRVAGYGGDRQAALRDAIDSLYVERPAGMSARAEVPDLQDRVANLKQAIRMARRQGDPPEVIQDLQIQAEQAQERLRLMRRDASPDRQRYLMPSLEQLQGMRTSLRQKYLTDPTRTDIAEAVRPLYDDLTRVMRRSSPQWWAANRRWGDLTLDEMARDLGASFAQQAGPRYREQMNAFRGMGQRVPRRDAAGNPVLDANGMPEYDFVPNAEAQNYVRAALAQQFADRLVNTPEGFDLQRLFRTPHMREMVRDIFGDDAAVELLRQMRDQRVAAQSNRMMHGSPTQPRQARQAEMNADLDLLGTNVSDIPVTPAEAASALRKWTINRWKNNRANEIARITTTPMRDVPAVAQEVELMRESAREAARAAAPRGWHWEESPAIVGRTAPEAPLADEVVRQVGDALGPLEIDIHNINSKKRPPEQP